MFLKNYTSDVPASVTINRIQQTLLRAGVKSIEMDYGSANEVVAITFKIQMNEHRSIPVRMPADVAAAQNALWLDYIGTDLLPTGEIAYGSRKNKRAKDFLEQGQRTAWKLVQDWIEVQLSMIQMRQADPMQVFLPYVWDGRRTFYQGLKDSGFKALIPAKGESVEVVS